MRVISKYIFFLFLLKSTLIFAQTPHLSQKEKTSWREALELFEIKDYLTAKLYFDELYVKYSNWNELNFKMGLCSFFIKDYSELCRKNLLLAGEGGNIDAFYYLGLWHHYHNEIHKSLQWYEKYTVSNGIKSIPESEITRQREISIRALDFMSKPQDLRIKPLGSGINSPFPDYAPLITSDESMLFFTSRRENSTGGKKDPYGKYFEDVYISYRKENKWQEPIQLPSNINDHTHNAGVGLSPEGNILILYKTDKTLQAGDLYWSEQGKNLWSDPAIYPKNINTPFVESSASYTPDGNTLYFSSDAPGGLGGKDLYKCTKLPNGDWSLASNLGPNINTPWDDDAPFIHPNGHSLYFSSKGHNTMGEYDIFQSEWLDSLGWSSPENMGYPINSTMDDIFFTVSANGKSGYFSSIRKEGVGDQDIYEVELIKDPLPIIYGKIVSAKDTMSTIKASITLEHPQTQQIYGAYKSNAKTGNFILIAHEEEPYKLIIQAPGYEKKEMIVTFKIEDFTKTKLYILNPTP